MSEITNSEDFVKKEESKFFYGWKSLLILNVSAIFLSLVAICCCICSITLDCYNLILGFIGVLATFVVVSNYVQVMKIEEDTQKKIEQIENKLNGYKSELDKQKDLLRDKQTDNKLLEAKVSVLMESLNAFSQDESNKNKISVSSLENLENKAMKKWQEQWN